MIWNKGEKGGRKETRVSPLAIFVFNIRRFVQFGSYVDQQSLVFWGKC